MREILDARGEQYGDFTTQGEIAQGLKQYVRGCAGWSRLNAHQRESLEMIMHKVSRILNGNPDHMDSWVDIAGYAQLVADRVKDTEPFDIGGGLTD